MRDCTHRRDAQAVVPVWQCSHPRVHLTQQIVWPAICEACRFCDDGRRQIEPRAALPLLNTPSRTGVCRHLGPEVGRQICESCAGRVQLKVFSCAHPSHDQVTLNDCQTCPDHSPLTPHHSPTAPLCLRYDYGLGDAVQFTIVLEHLARAYPQRQIDVQATNAHYGLFRGLCNATYNLHDAGGRPLELAGYERTFRVPMLEVDRCYSDSPSTKIIRCLREVFRLQPIEELCHYKIMPNPEDHARAESYLRDVLGLEPQRVARDAANQSAIRNPKSAIFPVVLIHYQGFTHRAAKNLDEQTVRRLCRAVRAAGYLPLVLDTHRESQLVERGEVLGIRDDETVLWHPHGIQGTVITALIQRVSLFVGIDSGPGHCAGATDTPTLIYWGKPLHPLHYYDLADNVVHLVRAGHADDVHDTNRDAGLEYFEAKYRYRCYRKAEDMLPALALELLLEQSRDQSLESRAKRSAAGSRLSTLDSRLCWQLDLRVRAAPEHFPWDTHVIRTCLLEDEYQLAQIDLPPNPRILDVGANIGAFAAAAALRYQRPEICCVEPSPVHWPALRANCRLARDRHRARLHVLKAALVGRPGPPRVLVCDGEPGNTGATRAVLPASVRLGGEHVEGVRHWAIDDGRGHGVEAASSTVSVLTLPQLLELLDWPAVDLLKLDCEGAELELLEQAAEEDLARVHWIVGEYHDRRRFLAACARWAGWRLELDDGDPRGLFRLEHPTWPPADAT